MYIVSLLELEEQLSDQHSPPHRVLNYGKDKSE
jgi:hypothetical protein